jgi:molybdate-binding protein/DNA-binding XRE family transcriptional regulator
MAEVATRLADVRQQRGLSATTLARLAGVSRQTIYAMEAGTYVPNTAVALKLARALDSTVEQLFTLPEDARAQFPAEEAELLPGSDALQPGQPVQLCTVSANLIASVPAAVRWYLPPSDAVVAGCRGDRVQVEVFNPDSNRESRLLVAGCDPAISVLARHAESAGIELVLAHRNSSQALELLKHGSIHIAGTHLRDEPTGESNIPAIGRMFSRNSVAVISYAVWEEGIVTPARNPKRVRGISDFARRGVTIVNREPGSGARNLLDAQLKRAGIDARALRGYDHVATGHLAAAWQVQSGAADCCIATQAAARLFGLHFIPLVTERYDLVLRRRHLELAPVQKLFDILSQSRFRRELEARAGYEARVAGQRLM